MPTHLCTVYDYFCATRAELNNYNRDHLPQGLNYLLFGLLQKTLADPWSALSTTQNTYP